MERELKMACSDGAEIDWSDMTSSRGTLAAPGAEGDSMNQTLPRASPWTQISANTTEGG